MSLDQLRYFVSVAETGSTHAASRALHISQPPLSRHIKALEEELGVALFDRTARGMELRPEGRRFLVRAREVLGTLERAVDEVRRDRPPDDGLTSSSG